MDNFAPHDLAPARSHRRIGVLKVCYLLAVTTAVFASPAIPLPKLFVWLIVSAFLAVQVIILAASHVGIDHVTRTIWRLKWFFIFLLTMYAFLPPDETFIKQSVVNIPGLGRAVSINLSGLEKAALMCLQIVTVLLTTGVARLTGTGRGLLEGLHAFRLPPLFVHGLDQTLDLIGGAAGVRGGRRRADDGEPRTSIMAVLKQLAKGDLSAFIENIRSNIARAEGSHPAPDRLNRDVAIVTGLSLCMASLKIVKVLPGLPFASGHKTFLLFPLYVLASRLTNSRWGATSVGSIMAVIALFQGDGRFGPFELFKHIAPGIVIDLGQPVVRRLPWPIIGYSILGIVAAIARTATEFIVVMLLGAREEIYLFPAIKLVPNLIAGGLSGFVTVFVLRVFAQDAKSANPEATLLSTMDHPVVPLSSGRDGGSDQADR